MHTHTSLTHSIFTTTRYLHVLQPEVDAAVARRSSVPAVSSSGVAYGAPDRRGSEPALLQAEVMSRQVMSRRECRRSEFVVNVSSPQDDIGRLAADIGRLAADIAEEQAHGIGCFFCFCFFMGGTDFGQHISVLYFFFADNDPHLTASLESLQSSEVAQACAWDGKNEQVCYF